MSGDHTVPVGYGARWRQLNRAAWLYLIHAALITGSLAITSLLYNVAILSLGYDRRFLGLLSSAGVAAAVLFSLPLWWLAARIGFRRALLASALLQAASAFTFALWPAAPLLLAAAALTGVAAVLFQVSAPPLMMEYTDDATRDHLFSANAAVNIGVAGLGSWLAGRLPALFGGWFGLGEESALAYRYAFAAAGAGLLLAIIPLLAMRETPHAQNPQPTLAPDERAASLSTRLPASLRVLAANWRPLAQLLAPPLLISVGAALLIPYLNLFFKDRFMVGDATLGNIFALLGLGTGGAVLAAPLLSARFGTIRTVVLVQALSIPFLLLLGWTPLLGLAITAALMRAALFNMSAPLYDAFALAQTPPPARPAVIGCVNAAYSAGYLVGPLISGVVQEQYGFAPLFIATACCYTLAALLIYIWFVRATTTPTLARNVDSS
ncbi:MAG: MFS transporter [Roseiflexaceae bacterium]|nr:MFS transporter [Roseiflexaceae bacterium]